MNMEQVKKLVAFTDALNTRTAIHPWHRECSRRVSQLEAAFTRIRGALPSEDQEILDWYISACEELEYSCVFAAYAMGREHGCMGCPDMLETVHTMLEEKP